MLQVSLLLLYLSCFISSLPDSFVKGFYCDPHFSVSHHRLSTSLPMSSTSTNTEIEVIRQPDKEFLEKKGVFNWGTWGCVVSKFPWTHDSAESCYLLAGQVVVTPTDGRQPATFGKGDFVTFPAGMSCTWDVSEAVQKHFMFY